MDLFMFKAQSENKKSILRSVFKSNSLSRNTLADALGLSSATVSKLVFELIESGVIEEYGEMESTGGRKPVTLRIKPNFAYIISVDIGSFYTRIGVVQLDGTIAEKRMLPTAGFFVENLFGLIEELLTRYRKSKIIGIGVGISGMVNYQTGRVIFCPNIKGWDNISLVELLQNKYGITAFLDTSSRGMAIAEYWFGVGKQIQNQIFVSIGHGIGAGIIIDSRIFRGSSGFSGELGHIQVDEGGMLCTCGNYGCLENYVTVPLVISKVALLLQENTSYSPLRYMINDIKELNADILIKALETGDKIVYQALMETGKQIGIALANIANFINPELIVLGGGLVESFPIIVDEAARIIKERSLVTIQQDLKIRKSSLGNDGPILGSALLIINKFLE